MHFNIDDIFLIDKIGIVCNFFCEHLSDMGKYTIYSNIILKILTQLELISGRRLL